MLHLYQAPPEKMWSYRLCRRRRRQHQKLNQNDWPNPALSKYCQQ
jgi:hypothetical protein